MATLGANVLTLCDMVRLTKPKRTRKLTKKEVAYAKEMGVELLGDWLDAMGWLRYRTRMNGERRAFARKWAEDLRGPWVEAGGLEGMMWDERMPGPTPNVATLMNMKNDILDDVKWLT